MSKYANGQRVYLDLGGGESAVCQVEDIIRKRDGSVSYDLREADGDGEYLDIAEERIFL